MSRLRVYYDAEPFLLYPVTGISVYSVWLLRALLERDAVDPLTAVATVRRTNRRRVTRTLADMVPELSASAIPLPGRLASRLERVSLSMTRPRMPRPDVAHAPGNAPWGWFPFRSVPSVLTVHDVVFWHEQALDWTAEAYRERMDRSLAPLLPRADAILTVSRFSKAEIVRLTGLPSARIFVSPIATQWTGPPPEEAESAERLRALGLAPGAYLLAVGDITPRKNYEGLLPAFDRLRENTPEAELVVVGRHGFGSTEVIDRLRHGGGRTRWLQELPTADLRALYAGARAFVLPSWYEGFGIPVLEAMAAGCPVCCSTGSSLDEVAGDAALRVDPADGDGLADALGRLWTDAELRAALRAAGRVRATRFSWSRTAEITLRAYAYAIASRRGGAADVPDGDAVEAALSREESP